MKLYYHPAATTCRTIMLFTAEASVDLAYALIGLVTGARLDPGGATAKDQVLETL